MKLKSILFVGLQHNGKTFFTMDTEVTEQASIYVSSKNRTRLNVTFVLNVTPCCFVGCYKSFEKLATTIFKGYFSLLYL